MITENKELRSIKLLAHGKNYYVVYHRNLCYDRFFYFTYLYDLFLLLKETDFCNFADGTTQNLAELLEKLERNFELAIHWFEDNYMKLNTCKCHLLISGHKYKYQLTQIGKYMVWEENKVKLLGITIDSELKFESHILNICAKANKKLSVLCRLKNIFTFQQRRILFKLFLEAQFKYCPLIWMLCSRSANNKIIKLHKGALRIVYDDYNSKLEEHLTKDG